MSPEEKRAYNKAYAEKNKERLKAYRAERRLANRDEVNAKQQKFREENREQVRAQNRELYARDPQKMIDKQKAYQDRNREKVLAKKRSHYERTREEQLAYAQDYRKENAEAIAANFKEYYQKNKDELAEKSRLRNQSPRTQFFRNINQAIRLEHDVEFKLQKNLRVRIANALRNGAKRGSSVSDLGCTIDEFKAYLEERFLPGMSWDNWNRHGWHIDHIKPLASFDLTDREQFLQATHFTNMQPLWAADNLKKGARVAA